MALPGKKALERERKQKEREDYKRLVLQTWDRFDRADRHDHRDQKLEVERKAKDRL